ncbi:SpoIIE family protein phosphatase [Desulfobacterales bacterium HSG2]|nr:SpoIIE family protein phosphatase [Desulfobacterales bacterium HSG2]
MKTRSLYLKVNAAIFLTGIVIAAIFGGILYPAEVARNDSQFKKIRLLLDAVFQQKKENLANEIFARQIKALKATLRDIMKVEGINGIGIYDKDGKLLASAGAAASVRSLASSLSAAERRTFLPFVKKIHRRQSVAVYSTIIEVFERCVGYMKICYDLREMERETRLSVTIFVTLLLTILFVMSVLLNILLFRFVIRPVSVLSEAMNKARAGNLGDQVILSSQDEIGEMAAAFNKMSLSLHDQQEALKKTEEKYRDIFENAVEGIFQSTWENRFLTANSALAHILGYPSPGEIIETVTDIRDQLFVIPECYDELLRLAEEHKVISGFEIQLYRKDGSKVWVSLNARPVKDEDGELILIEGMADDIGQRKEAEALKQAYLARIEKEVEERTLELNEALEKIMDSIRYAERIQRSLLPNPGEVRTYLPDSFFLWMPRDIVGGDIYFTERFGDGIVIAVIDCTGHGVPGAFMSMIASSFIRRITTIANCHDPAEILKRLNSVVKTSLQQERKDAISDDGLDAAICFIEARGDGREVTGEGREAGRKSAPRLTYAGAKLPLFYVHNREITVINGDKQSIGYKRSDPDFGFSNHTVTIRKGMSFYMSSDGFWDQLGGERGRSFGKKRFRNLLREVAELPFEEQREILAHRFEEYKGENDRQDDVTVAGFGFANPSP